MRKTIPGPVHAAAGLLLAAIACGAASADINMRLHTLVKSPHPYNDMAEHMEARGRGQERRARRDQGLPRRLARQRSGGDRRARPPARST
ncbi:MAG: hypothetical protein M5U08_15840 [Burkholderiales bacterium]|nr:hypothetical protein [Burkholderiales bacterium]